MNLQQLETELKQWRHHLHANPESAFEEVKTAEFVVQKLTEMGIDVHTNIGKTGVVGILKCGDNPTVIGLRADMDCIELTEKNQFNYASKTPNRMHACGHDGHVTILLGAAKLLSESKNFDGTVCFVFQPSEEQDWGAKAMIKDGVIEKFNIKEIYGVHNMPGIPQGKIAMRVGGIMGSEDNFVIRIKGFGFHASRPHEGKDPLVIAAEIIMALQTIASRNIGPSIPIVVSCTELHTDGIRNAIPSNVVIKGDTRSYDPKAQKLIEDRMRTICQHICAMNEAECEFEYTHEFAPTVNWAECVDVALNSAKNVVGENNVDSNVAAMMSSEDFGYFLQKIPGCYAFIGNGVESDGGKGHIPLHNAEYDFNDNNLIIGAQFFADIIATRLTK